MPRVDAVVEKQARVEVVGEVDLELQSALVGHEHVLLPRPAARIVPCPRCRSRFFRKT